MSAFVSRVARRSKGLSLVSKGLLPAAFAAVPASSTVPQCVLPAVAVAVPRAFYARSFAASAADEEELRASMHKHGRSTKDAKKWEEFKQGLPAKFCDDLMYRYSQFRQADKDKDGKMTVEELKSLFEKMEGTTDTDIETLLAAADVDGDGVLDINEFVKLFEASK